MMRPVDLGLGALVVALALFVLDEAAGYDAEPALAPQLLAILLGLCGVALAIPRLAGKAAEIEWRRQGRPLAVALCALAFLMLLPRLGYEALAFVAFVAVARVLGEPFSLRLFVVGAICSAAVWLVFAFLLGVPLPSLIALNG